ncbi:hypothetical protein PACTADRAFT_49295 [Pachysolen tannophilus NRRL Y-2460]|uniref:Phospholipid/glycerol acyltransferase domain-containing protein n=1 Tax=Pachysolen tannophilus NRRL Y-2460 TaxID=669874 RepID=A0A1E4TVS0_PACTA|nr:hypothetical protein PACTADRAFT_49295 [Pachysolen tannophilus NRRL Y-2460]
MTQLTGGATNEVAHVPAFDNKETNFYYEDEVHFTLSQIFYDCAMLFFNWLYHIFFREVKVRSAFNIPTKGPALLVCAPHANQFVDPSLLMLQVKKASGRNVSFLVAAAYYRKKFIGFMSRLAGAIPVERAQDMLNYVEGEIKFENFENDPCIIIGKGTHFKKNFTPKGLIGLPSTSANAQILEIIDDTKLILKKPFKSEKATNLLKNFTKFKYAPKIDNSQVFQKVFDHLHRRGLIGIFPEGGSHDRTELLPIKPGVAIMALGAVAAEPSCEIKIVPCGMNYFHPNKFRSRAVVEFGTPMVVTAKDGEYYKENPREAVSALMDQITNALKTVTVTCPDYETLMTIQAARRLYSYPKRKQIPLPLVVEMNRRLAIGYVTFKDDPRIIQLTKNVNEYNKKLEQLGIKDHQLESLSKTNFINTFVLLIQRLISLSIFALLSLPGTILFSPVFIAAKIISKRKAKEALANSVVKIRGTDVLATWKLMVAMAFAPILYIIYSIIGTIIILDHPESFWFLSNTVNKLFIFINNYLILVATTYSAFKIGEVGMDIFKSIKPLILSLGPSQEQLINLKQERKKLSLEVTELCNNLGPKVFPDFDKFYQKGLELFDEQELENNDEAPLKKSASSVSLNSGMSEGSTSLSRVNSVKNLSDVPIFSDSSRFVLDGTPDVTKRSVDDVVEGVSTGLDTDGKISLNKRIRDRFIEKSKEQNFADSDDDDDDDDDEE